MRKVPYLVFAVIGLGLIVGIYLYGQTAQQTGSPPATVASSPNIAPPAAAPPAPVAPPAAAAVNTVPGMPPVVDPNNLYSEIGADKISPATVGALERIYVPHVRSGDVYVIDPATFQVIDKFKVGPNPQHVIPSWDLKTLWVAASSEGGKMGRLTPIDPTTGKPGEPVRLRDAYNMYYTPDGKSAIVVAEALKQLDFRDAKTMELQHTISTPNCPGINHADFAIDGNYVIFTCEFSGGLIKIDLTSGHAVGGFLKLSKGGMPQDIRISPDGKVFFVADMHADGIFVIDGETFKEIGFIDTGVGTHGLYPSRDGKKLYVTNRGSNMVGGPPKGKGSIAVVDFATRTVEKIWPIPGGGSPDMGNVSADGKMLWLSGRFDNVVYAIDTTTGEVKIIPVGREPHGLTVWPQPGRYSLGHTGNMR